MTRGGGPWDSLGSGWGVPAPRAHTGASSLRVTPEPGARPGVTGRVPRSSAEGAAFPIGRRWGPRDWSGVQPLREPVPQRGEGGWRGHRSLPQRTQQSPSLATTHPLPSGVPGRPGSTQEPSGVGCPRSHSPAVHSWGTRLPGSPVTQASGVWQPRTPGRLASARSCSERDRRGRAGAADGPLGLDSTGAGVERSVGGEAGEQPRGTLRARHPHARTRTAHAHAHAGAATRCWRAEPSRSWP